jgi:ClpA/ClpB-like protein
MFSLEQAVKDWRHRMAARGIKAAEVLDELEGHLRDEIERQIRSGANEQEAYQAALACIGEPNALKAEFAKLAANNRRPRFVRTCYVIFAACVLLINAWTLLEYEMSALERALGFAAVSLICLYLAILPYLLKSLRASSYGRFAKVIKLASSLIWLWPLAALLEAEHIVDAGMGIVPTMLFWCVYAALAMTVVAFGLNGRGRSLEDSGGPQPPPAPNWQPIPPSRPRPPRFAVSVPRSKPVDPIVRQSFEAACDEANRLGHDFIGTEHVLLGLLQLAKGSFANILRRMNLDREMVRGEVERLIPSTPTRAATVTLPFTPRATKAVKLAAREAKALSHPCITAELVFLGLLLEGGGVAALVLRKLGIHPERAREEILREVRTHTIC